MEEKLAKRKRETEGYGILEIRMYFKINFVFSRYDECYPGGMEMGFGDSDDEVINSTLFSLENTTE